MSPAKASQAAMHVSMLIGVIRHGCPRYRLIQPSCLENSTIALLDEASGISTALAAHVSANGLVTIANAGHLSPYLDGREIELPGALPLGIAEGGAYTPVRFELLPGSRLTFYSDGVVEAQNKAGELFGFDRVRAISTESADAIVEKAVQFGQADDITVVTVERLAVSGWNCSPTLTKRPQPRSRIAKYKLMTQNTRDSFSESLSACALAWPS